MTKKRNIFPKEEIKLIKTKNTIDKIDYIGSRKMLRVEKWRVENGHWRTGIEWYGEDRFEFICEKPTIDECLDLILDYMCGDIK